MLNLQSAEWQPESFPTLSIDTEICDVSTGRLTDGAPGECGYFSDNLSKRVSLNVSLQAVRADNRKTCNSRQPSTSILGNDRYYLPLMKYLIYVMLQTNAEIRLRLPNKSVHSTAAQAVSGLLYYVTRKLRLRSELRKNSYQLLILHIIIILILLILYVIFFLMARQPLGGLGRLTVRGFTITL
jgi:hypothetical protein